MYETTRQQALQLLYNEFFYATSYKWRFHRFSILSNHPTWGRTFDVKHNLQKVEEEEEEKVFLG